MRIYEDMVCLVACLFACVLLFSRLVFVRSQLVFLSKFGDQNRLIDEGKLMDALALSDRFLRNGASDRLLQLLIEHGEDTSATPELSQGYSSHRIWSNSWQHCLRMKDKHLAAILALKYVS